MPDETRVYPLGDLPRGVHNFERRDYMCQRTGEFRPPRKGEWYLSGAIPTGYRAPADLATPYFIVRLVQAWRQVTWHAWTEAALASERDLPGVDYASAE